VSGLVHPGRVWRHGDSRAVRGPVLYWMHREHRAHDNWALLHAIGEAKAAGAPLAVVWCLSPRFLDAAYRQFHFLLRGMRGTAETLREHGIPFFLLQGDPADEVPRFAATHGTGLVVTDFDVLRLKRAWLGQVREALACPLHEVDGRNVVPCRMASDKREYAARTLRPKIHRLLPEYLDPFPSLATEASGVAAWKAPVPDAMAAPDWDALLAAHPADRSVPALTGPDAPVPGEEGARRTLETFLASRIHRYEKRNDPNADAVSGLSPYLHFGMMAAQRVVQRVTASTAGSADARASFIEELVVRRELADNFCLHTPDYDAVTCFPTWAQGTLDRHRDDPRPHLYDEAALEKARTADPLWNAAQTQLMRCGVIHGYMRMYWAKQLLLWTPTPEEAMRIAVRQNDRWALDGRDSNGYAGIAWSLGGVHDRPWGERPVQGTIRCMTYNGARGKFDVAAYIARMESLRGGGQARLPLE